MSMDPPQQLSVGTLLFIAQRAFEEEIATALHEQGFQFTLAQGRLAARIAQQGSRLTELADAAGITKQSAAYLLKELERSGLVLRQPDPSDARAQRVLLTTRGLAAQQVARGIEQGIERRWAQLIGAANFARLKSALEDLRPHLDRHQGDSD
ncbi:MarR family winged helix-turn-helix transcriptional regulator [Glutamicibacter arilaitensis]